MYKDEYEYKFINSNNIIEEFIIRPLSKNDIKEISRARKEQEVENGNGATDEYIYNYNNVINYLFDNNKLIVAGAFKNKKLVSIAFYNLISLGEEKLTPYLCGVWTDYNERGKKLANNVNTKITEGIYERKKEISNYSLLTLEGNAAAYNLYKKLGYKEVKGEMVFIGDIKETKIKFDNIISNNNNKNIYINSCYRNEIEQIRITFSKEQFMSHPKNLDGKMARIKSISILNKNVNYEDLINCLENFFHENRFCKFNVNEVLRTQKNLNQDKNIDNTKINDLKDFFEKIEFKDINNNIVKIKSSNSVMEKCFLKDFDLLEEKIFGR